MKLRTQIFAGYLLLTFLLGLVALIALKAIDDVADTFDAAVNQNQPILSALNHLREMSTELLLVAMAPAAPGVFLARENAEQSQAATGSPALHVTVTPDILLKQLAKYQELVTLYFPDETDHSLEIGALTQGFIEAVAAYRAVRNTSSLDIVQRQAELASRHVKLVESLEKAVKEEIREFEELQEGVGNLRRDHLKTVLGVTVLALLATLLGGALIAQRISRPLRDLRQAAKNLATGRFDARLHVGARNEIGELESAFNEMAGKLSTSVMSRAYVEGILESLAEGVLVLDEKGRIERSNSVMRELFNEEFAGPLVGRSVRDVFLPDPSIDALLADHQDRKWFELKLAGTRLQGILVAVAASPIDSGSGRNGRVLLVQDITERRRQEDRLNYLASYDPLTGLPNRRMFMDQARAVLSRLPWNERHAGILFCGLDRFKFVNDSLGHEIGDVLIRHVAERLKAAVRPGDIVARWAGDEFIILLGDVSQAQDLAAVADKLVERLRQPVQIGPHELFVTLSVGLSCAPEDSQDVEELIKNADMALHAAKATGRNQYLFYAPEMRMRSDLRLQLERTLRHAIAEGMQLQAHYQPQQRMNGDLIGFEALVRWQHPELGLISPAQFLPAAEEAGLMAALDESVLRMACAELRRWRDEGSLHLRMAVNLSNQSFRRDDLAELVLSVLAGSGIPPSALELELTEEIVMENIGMAVEKMQQLRDLGVHLSIDDFGTGYSSLAQLKRCPITLLKIDRSFIIDITRDPSDRAITDAIIALAHKLGIQVLAEGVETEAQLALLRQFGCDAIQGYLLSKPLPAEAAFSFIRQHPLREAV